MQCLLINVPIRKSDRIIGNGVMRARMRPKQTKMEAIMKDMLMFCVTEGNGLKRAELKKLIHKANLKNLG